MRKQLPLAAGILVALAGVLRGEVVYNSAATAQYEYEAEAGWNDPLLDNLVLRFWFDPAATNAAGEVVDSSRYNNNGAPETSAWSLSGTNAVADSPLAGRLEHAFGGRIRVADSPSFTFRTPSGDLPFSLATWAKPAGLSFIVLCREAYRGEWIALLSDVPGLDGMRLECYAPPPDYFSKIGRYSGVSPSNDIGEWHHYVFVYDGSGSGNGIAFYRDGEPQTGGGLTDYGAWTGQQDSASDILIGNNANGLIDDVRLYNLALPLAQVTNLYWNTRKPSLSNEGGY